MQGGDYPAGMRDSFFFLKVKWPSSKTKALLMMANCREFTVRKQRPKVGALMQREQQYSEVPCIVKIFLLQKKKKNFV